MGVQVTPDLFAPAPAVTSAETISRPSLSFWRDAWRRLKQNRLAIVSMYVLLVIALFSLVAPLFSQYSFSDQDLKAIGQAPSLRHWLGTDDLGRDLFARRWMGGRVALPCGLRAGARRGAGSRHQLRPRDQGDRDPDRGRAADDHGAVDRRRRSGGGGTFGDRSSELRPSSCPN